MDEPTSTKARVPAARAGFRTAPTRPSARRLLAENIRILRLLRNLSQEALADLSGLDRSYLGSIERGERNPTLDKLERLAEAFGITVQDLLKEQDPHQIAEELIEAIRNPKSGHSRSRY